MPERTQLAHMTERRKSILTTIFLALVVLAFATLAYMNVIGPTPDCRWEPDACEVRQP